MVWGMAIDQINQNCNINSRGLHKLVWVIGQVLVVTGNWPGTVPAPQPELGAEPEPEPEPEDEDLPCVSRGPECLVLRPRMETVRSRIETG